MTSNALISDTKRPLAKIKDTIDPRKCYILTPPTELLTITVEDLEQEDLRMIRRTCKTLCNVATLPFARTMPTTRRFRFVKEDMDRLVGLAGHPIFGSMLKCISFDTSRVAKLENLVFYRKAMGFVNFGTDKQTEHVGSQYWYYSDLEDQLDANNRLAETQKRYISAGTHVTRLTQALNSFSAQKHPGITLGIHDSDDGNRGQLISELRANEIYDSLSGNDSVSTLYTLENAMELSNFPATKIQLDLIGSHHPDSDSDICRDTTGGAIWEAMKPVPLVSVLEFSAGRSELKMKNFSFVSKAGDDCDPSPAFAHDNFWNLFHWFDAKLYEVMILDQVYAEYNQLKDLFDHDRLEEMKRLEVRNSRFEYVVPSTAGQTSGTSITLFRHLQESTMLEELLLENLTDEHNDWIVKKKVHWKGQEEIQAGLEDLVEKMTAWRWDQ